MESVHQVEKKTLPQAIEDVSEFVCVTAQGAGTKANTYLRVRVREC